MRADRQRKANQRYRVEARNTNYSYARPSGDCCGPVVGLSSLTKVHRIAANIAKLPELLRKRYAGHLTMAHW
jgi:hypothetical protein